MRKVFLDDLVYGGKYIPHNRINWSDSVNQKIKFIYDNITGWMELVDYNWKTNKLTIKYNNNEYKMSTGNFSRCQLGKLLGIRTSDFKIEIGTSFKDEKRDITIIDREYRDNPNNKGEKISKYYKYHCNKDGYEDWKEERKILCGTGCLCCKGEVVVKGINDVATTHPHLTNYFVNIEDAYNHTYGSHNNVFVKCLDCNNITSIKIKNLTRHDGFSCKKCGDGISAPNKIMFNILKQLQIKFMTEYSPDWIGRKRYDFYFKINDKEYILEMDGGFHNNNNKMSGQTAEEIQKIDDYKDEQAKLHGIEVIRIDCNYGSALDKRFGYIKNNILNNKRLNELFNLTKIDWQETNMFSNNSLIKIACEIKRNNPNMTTNDISVIMGYNKGTICNWLKEGSNINLCDYNPKTEKKKANVKICDKIKKQRSKPVINIDDGQLFESARTLEKVSLNIFGEKLDRTGIGEVCRGKQKYYKGYQFKYISDLTPEEYIKHDIENKLKELHNKSLGQAI